MGIKGIYKEIGPGKRVALCKLAVDQLERTGRPLRLAIDISIWQFQVQAAKGGTNPAIRTLFYRLVRLLGLSIKPLFVFDGPNKPAFKRNKRSYGPGNSVATAMAKRLINLFGFDTHDAPGEAEAECALLQRRGVVDAVLSEDVDTIMFGCSRTLRNWTAEGKGAKTPTHVSMYDVAELGQSESGLDREGMVLVAMMSGGDYVPAGVPGCGVKVACEAAKGGFGRTLCKIKRSDPAALSTWKEHLVHELRTNESGFFRTRHKALDIPEDFPNMEVLRYYTHPVVSQDATVERLRQYYPSRKQVDIVALREFVRETFDWTYRIGAVKLIRVLSPSLLVQAMLNDLGSDSRRDESTLVKDISSKRAHFSTDATPELRISYVPNDIVKIDLDAEPQEVVSSFGREGLALNSDDEFEAEDQAKSSKRIYDPLSPELIWLPEAVAKVGAPLTVDAWQERQRARELKSASKTARKPKTTKPADMPMGALDKYVKFTKPTEPTDKEVDIADSPTTSFGQPPLANLRGSDLLLSSQTSSLTSRNPPQPTLHPSVRSKQVPKHTSKSRKAQAATATKPAAQTNPWTLAGSHVSPSVVKCHPTHDRSTAPPKSAASTSRLQQFDNEPILISSSPFTSPSPAATAQNISQGARQFEDGAHSAFDNGSADPNPPRGCGWSSPGQRVSLPEEDTGNHAFPCPPGSGKTTSLALRMAPDWTDSPKGKTEPPRCAESDGQGGVAQKQVSIMNYVLKEARNDHINARSLAANSILSLTEPIEISDDDEKADDALSPPVLSSKPPSQEYPQTPKKIYPAHRNVADPGRTGHFLSSQNSPEQDNMVGLPSKQSGRARMNLRIISPSSAGPPRPDNPRFGGEDDPFSLSQSVSTSRENQCLPKSAPATSGVTQSLGKTKLYIPRRSEIGYFKEVEVSREEADRIMAGDSTHEAIKGSHGRILRQSDVGVIDLTEIDD